MSFKRNISKVFLDSRLGPTLSCLVAEKKYIFKSATFCHNNKFKVILESTLIL